MGGAWDKRCLKQRVNHPKMDASVPGRVKCSLSHPTGPFVAMR
jgi:hypothetical protein